MNPWQLAKQFRFLLAARLWQETGGTTVFGSVTVTNAPTASAVSSLICPFVFIRIGAASADEERPGYLHQVFNLDLCTSLSGDQYGENALIGANRNAGSVAVSDGRGLLEVEEELLGVVRQVQETSGVKIIASHRSDVDVVGVSDMMEVLTRTYTITADCTDQRYYHPPMNLTATATGGGNVNLAWTLPPNRYDRYRVILRRAAGSTPPASATAGTGITLSGNLATSVTDSPGAGTFSYAIFASYDETAATPAADQRFSSQETGTTRTVVVT